MRRALLLAILSSGCAHAAPAAAPRATAATYALPRNNAARLCDWEAPGVGRCITVGEVRALIDSRRTTP